MIHVNLAATRALIEVPDRESPWGTSLEFNPEIARWLDDHGANWDWDAPLSGPHISVRLTDPDLALMLKLTWG